MRRPRPKSKVSFFKIYFCCFWISVTQINFENIKKIQRIISYTCFQLKSRYNVDARAPSIPLLNFPFNPILTGLFESKFLLGGVNLTPPSDLGADRRKILHGCQDTCKEYCYNLFLAEIGLFIMLLWFMQIRCIIITYLLIFRTNKISEGQFLAESFVAKHCKHVGMFKFVNSKFIPLYFIVL